MRFTNTTSRSKYRTVTDKPKVFISYSRADSAFTDELNRGLEWAGFETTIDRESVVEGENWKRRLGNLIAAADTVVFILSPASAASDVCAWEVDEAVRLSKRLLPVLIEPIGTIPVPGPLELLHYVRFDPQEDGRPRSFMDALRAVVNALNTDLEWLREHTRLHTRAGEWEEDGRPNSRLLRGDDVRSAKHWLTERPKNAPAITDLHYAFIEASEQAEIQRANEERRRLEEMAAAQNERAQALDDREVAVKKVARRTFLGISGTSIFGIGASIAFYQANKAKEQATIDRIERENIQNALNNSKLELQNWKQLIGAGTDISRTGIVERPVEVITTESRNNTGGQATSSWAVKAIGADRSDFDGSGVVMAYIGAGLDANHPSFAGMEIIQKDFSGEGNGDNFGHGTGIASLAFGKPFDGQRLGVATGVRKVLVAKVLGQTGGAGANAVPIALDWLANYDGGIVDVAFLDLGIDYAGWLEFLQQRGESVAFATATIIRGFLQALRTIESISLAISVRGKGITLISAGGNSSHSPPPRIPVTSPYAVAKGFISVGSINRGDNGYEVSGFSNSEVTLCAPGQNVPIANLGGGIRIGSGGTSFSCALAAGTAALWWQAVHSLSSDAVVTADQVWEKMRAGITQDGFAPDVKPSARGLGLVQAPGLA